MLTSAPPGICSCLPVGPGPGCHALSGSYAEAMGACLVRTGRTAMPHPYLRMVALLTTVISSIALMCFSAGFFVVASRHPAPRAPRRVRFLGLPSIT